jgi:hypothetical protein
MIEAPLPALSLWCRCRSKRMPPTIGTRRTDKLRPRRAGYFVRCAASLTIL